MGGAKQALWTPRGREPLDDPSAATAHPIAAVIGYGVNESGRGPTRALAAPRPDMLPAVPRAPLPARETGGRLAMPDVPRFSAAARRLPCRRGMGRRDRRPRRDRLRRRGHHLPRTRPLGRPRRRRLRRLRGRPGRGAGPAAGAGGPGRAFGRRRGHASRGAPRRRQGGGGGVPQRLHPRARPLDDRIDPAGGRADVPRRRRGIARQQPRGRRRVRRPGADGGRRLRRRSTAPSPSWCRSPSATTPIASTPGPSRP